LRSSGGAVTGGLDKDKYVNEVSEDVLSKLPLIWDVIALRKEAGEVITPT
jgi:hypothetical protein